MTVSERIKSTRENLNMSQEELAKKCGYANRSAISKIESSGDEISTKKIKKIAKALSVTEAYLMGWDENAYNFGAELANNPMRMNEFLDIYNLMNDEQKELWLNIGKTMLKK